MMFLTLNSFLCQIVLFVFSISSSEKIENELDIPAIFQEHQIVPLIFPSSPKDLCPVIYQSRVIIATGKFYFPYQVEGTPEISWDFKRDKFYTLIAIEAIQKQNTRVTTTTENIHFLGVLKKVYDDPAGSNSTKNTSSVNTDDVGPPPENWWYRWVVVDIEENDIETGTVLLPFSSSAAVQPNSTHQIVYVFGVFEQSTGFELKLDDKDNSPEKLLRNNFTPLSKFAENFCGENSLIVGNFYYVVPRPKVIFVNSPVQKIRWLT